LEYYWQMKPEELPNPDNVLKRMLNTPPKPRTRAKKRTKKPAK